jgi:uncharacterized protein YyaL (SSP411 family)
MAIRNADFLTSKLTTDDRLFRIWRAGKAGQTVFLDDYAALILGLISLYQTNPDSHWFTTALLLGEQMLTYFQDSTGGFYDTRDDHEDLLLRPKDLQDNAVPSGNALAALALLQLAAYQGKHAWRDISERMLGSMQDLMVLIPLLFRSGYAQWIFVESISEVAILGDPKHPLTEQFIETLWSIYRPDTIVAIASDPPASGSPELLSGRHTVNNLPTAFVCRSFVCSMPTTSVEEFTVQLASIHLR